MEFLLLLSILIGLWLFIRRDQASFKNPKQEPLTREQIDRGFVPDASFAWKGIAGVALMATIGSVQQLLSPSLPPFSGRWSFIYATLYENIGKYGIAIVWAACALVFASLAYLKFKAVQKHR
jgi:hypothetical protein